MERFVGFDREGWVSDNTPCDGELEGLGGGAGCNKNATIVSWFPRVALRDCQIEGFHIKKGWIVNVDARSIHHDPLLYGDPFEFNPSRFDVELKACSFLAFGTRGRTCLGINLAKPFMMVFLHCLVTTYRWRVADKTQALQNGPYFQC